jgi:tRNA threonylcarbamoyladenosine biosynthesis protein TsaB
MIDARRMEVYMALYDRNNREVMAPCAEIITGDTFHSYVRDHNLILAGDGALKCKEVLNPEEKFIFSDAAVPSAQFMISLAEAAFNASHVEDTAYFEPYYLKDFIAGKPKVKGL